MFEMVENILPGGYEIKRHHSPDFLGQQHVDGAIYKNKILICGMEYDGIQHFEPVKFWGGKEGFIRYKKRDRKKNKKFKDNNVPLIRFSYKEEITKELIMEKLVKVGVF